MGHTGPNQDVPRTAFLAGGSQEKSFSCLFQLLEAAYTPQSWSPCIFKASNVGQVFLTSHSCDTDSLASARKDPCDDDGLAQVIQNNLCKVQLISSLTSPSLYDVTYSQVQGLGNQDVDIFEAIILPIMIGNIILSYFPREENEAQRDPVTC